MELLIKPKLICIGAGGHGCAVAEAILLSDEYELLGFLDDSYPEQLKAFGQPILGKISELSQFKIQAEHIFVAIGNNQIRENHFLEVIKHGFNIPSVIHPKAIVSPSAQLGQGIAIMAGAIVGTEAVIGNGALININAAVDHHCVLEDFAHLGVGVSLAGGVKVGKSAWLEAGCVAGYGRNIADYARFSPGSIIP